MRKIIFYGILIFIFSVFTGYMYSKLWKNKNKIETIADYSNQTYENEIKETSSEYVEKVSYKAKFALKKQYSDCGHTIIDTSELPIEFINLTKEEILCHYSDWEIEEFNNSSIILSKNISGICDDHFRIKLKDHDISVFNLTSNGEEIYFSSTEISKEYLPDEDLEKLEEGIDVYGITELNSVIENYE